MASPPLQVLYLETMEKAENKSREPNTIGDSRMASLGCKQLPEVLLAHGEEWSCPKGTLKRKTRTGGIP